LYEPRVQGTAHRGPCRVRALDEDGGDGRDRAAYEPSAGQGLQSGVLAGVRCAPQHERDHASDQRERDVAAQTDDHYGPGCRRPDRHPARASWIGCRAGHGGRGGADPEGGRSADRVSVGGDDPPCDDVGAFRQTGRHRPGDGAPDRGRVGSRHGDAAAVDQPDAAVDQVDRFGECHLHLGRGSGQLHSVRRGDVDQFGVRRGRGGEQEREHDGKRPDKGDAARCGAQRCH
jgi:hypothetical protein